MLKYIFGTKRFRIYIILFSILVACSAALFFASRHFTTLYITKCFKNTYESFCDDLNTVATNLGYENEVENITIETDDLKVFFGDAFKMEEKGHAVFGDKGEVPKKNAVKAAEEITNNYEYTKEFFRSLDVTRDNSEYIVFDGNKIKCKVYNVYIDEAELREYISHIGTEKTSNFLRSRIKSDLTVANERLKLDIPQSAIDAFTEYITSKKPVCKENVAGGINVAVWVHKNKVYRVKTTLNFENTDFSRITADFAAGDVSGKMLNRLSLHIGAVVNGEKLNINLDGSGDISEHTEKFTYRFSSNIMYSHIDSFKVNTDVVFESGEISLSGGYLLPGFFEEISGNVSKNVGKDSLRLKYTANDGKTVLIYTEKG